MPYKMIITLCLLLTMCSCVHTPSNIDEIQRSHASKLDLEFTHQYWPNENLRAKHNLGFENSRDETTHAHNKIRIYIHGDGIPWLAPGKIAREPSPNYELTWELLKHDNEPALMLSRPCYFGAAQTDKRCTPAYWTSHRYSEKVVASMSNAVHSIYVRYDAAQIELVGYSGGGALAMLIALQLTQGSDNNALANSDIRVTTVAANLDTDVWAQHHRYSPLTGSLNPTDHASLNDIKQRHFCGSKDKNVPIKLNTSYFEKQALRCQSVEADHNNGWIEHWASLLKTPFSDEQP